MNTQPWFRIAVPQKDIKQGHLDESVYAANLSDVVLGEGAPIYRDAEKFFAKTFPTAGLKNVARRVLKALSGKEEADNRIINLSTGFGGGKTHTLISLYHLCKWGRKAADSHAAEELLAFTGVPDFEEAAIAVFTNTTNDPASGRTAKKGQHIRTLWGELAWQLGGTAAYEIIRANDEQQVAPGGLFKKVLQQCKPCLILVDELADYCVKASGIRVGSGTLADQTTSFMQELTEAVAATPQSVLVATLPASPQEVGNSVEAQAILNTLQRRIGRMSADSQPVADEEIFEVIRRRLFEEITDNSAVTATVNAYADMYADLQAELPHNATRSDYKQKMIKAYPFHPELIDAFRLRWASSHEFQRTRGVLRLLAAIVSQLWKEKDTRAALIHASDVDFLKMEALSSQLKKLYGNPYDAVITADVAGAAANASKIDDDKSEYGQWNLTKGIASIILLNSFGSDGANRGVSVSDIKLQALRPGAFNHNGVNGALYALEGVAHYLYYSSAGEKRYWFYTKPNINILINQAKHDVDDGDIESEIIKRLNAQTTNLTLFRKALVAPDGEIPEQRDPTLIILGPKHAVAGAKVNGGTLPLITQMATKRGKSERIYRNTLLFLLPTDVGISALQNLIRDHMACDRIGREYSSQLEREQKDELRRRSEESSRAVDTALVKAYSILVKFSAMNGPAQLSIKTFRDRMDVQIQDAIIRTLKEEEWLLEKVGLQTLREASLLPQRGKPIRVRDVYEAFIRYDDKPMVTGTGAVQEGLLRYCNSGEFAIASGEDPEHFTQHTINNYAPFFDVTAADYWLVDKADVPEQQSAQVKEPPSGGEAPTTGLFGGENGQHSSNGTSINSNGGSSAKAVRSVTVSGKVPTDQYAQIFTSFVVPLVNNGVEIEIRIRGKSTAAKPLTESSPEYKVVKESAKQLGLTFEEE